MCNAFVDLIFRVDKKEIFQFAPLPGETARAKLPDFPEDPMAWSMLYLDENGLNDQSDASLEVYRRLRGAWRLLALLQFLPAGLRNPIYRIIAHNRYKVFGKRGVCRLPNAEERMRFLP
jgi:predicted DCC family thiol-disulfide oxidoreductase YuxK